MTLFSCESDSAEQASTTADEDNGDSTRHSTSDSVNGSTTDTDSNNELSLTPFATKNMVPKEINEKKYSNGIFDNKKLNLQSDTETRNLLDDVGEDFDEDYNLNLQESEIELDPRMFDLSEEQLNYYTNCFLYLMQKTQGSASMNGAIQGVDRIVLDFFRKSRLDNLSLSKIWSLSDVNEDGFLNLSEFIIAMHLIVLHVKCNVSIPAELPQPIRLSNTPTRTLVRFEDGIFGAFPESRPNSAINSFTKFIPECISSSSGDSQQMTKSLLNSNEKQVSTSKVVPGLPQLLASTARGPPPQPPYRDYNEGNKGHGRSVSLDLKTFSALSSFLTNKDNKQGYDMVDCSKSVLSTNASSHTGFVDKSAQTELNVISTCTQTETDDIDDQLLFSIHNFNANNLTPKERCKVLQQINERLEMEKLTLMQVRLQVKLRIEEAEAELKHFKDNTNSDQQIWGLKPTAL
ncbi:unnamed protein product [Meloidogyne enterolobii]|uniref:Uncharacterized protein n=1 Tax=Meloidogyne enterolobii TaxID=390850 RepID=A0ACB0Y211_MELEN